MRNREREINEKKANFKCHYNQQAWYLFNLFFFTKKKKKMRNINSLVKTTSLFIYHGI